MNLLQAENSLAAGKPLQVILNSQLTLYSLVVIGYIFNFYGYFKSVLYHTADGRILPKPVLAKGFHTSENMALDV